MYLILLFIIIVIIIIIIVIIIFIIIIIIIIIILTLTLIRHIAWSYYFFSTILSTQNKAFQSNPIQSII